MIQRRVLPLPKKSNVCCGKWKQVGTTHRDSLWGVVCFPFTRAREWSFFLNFWASHLVSLSRTRINTTIELNRLPYRDRREYQIAKDTVEPLVQRETPLIRFLRTDDYNPQAAARRMIELVLKARGEGEQILAAYSLEPPAPADR